MIPVQRYRSGGLRCRGLQRARVRSGERQEEKGRSPTPPGHDPMQRYHKRGEGIQGVCVVCVPHQLQ